MAEPEPVVLPGPLGGHPGSVFTVACSSGGMLASGGWDGTVRLWEPTGTAAGVLTGHAGPVTAVAFAPDGTTLASCGRDRTIRLWDTTARVPAWLLRGHEGTVLSLAFAPGGARLASAAGDGTVRLWDLASGTQAGELPDDARAVAFSPDGRLLASAGRDGMIRLRDIAGDDPAPVGTLNGHGGPVLSVAFAPGGGRLASAGSGTVRLWDLGSGEEVDMIDGYAGAVAFSPDGRTLASTLLDAGTLLWDLADGSRRSIDQARRCHGLAFSPDGTRLATAGDAGDIRIHDLAGGTVPVVLTGHVCEILSAACSPDGRLLATGDADGAIRIWNTADGSLAGRLTGHRDWVRSLAFSRGGTILAAAVGTDICRWAVARRFPKAADISRPHPVTAVAFGTADAGTDVLLSADEGGRLATWDTNGVAVAQAGGAAGPVMAAAVSGDGTAIVGVGSDGVVRRWDRSLTGVQAFAPAISRARCVAVSRDGQVLAAGGADGVMLLWNAANPAASAATLTGHQGVVRALAFAPDGTLLASGADDATVRLWDTRNLVTARKLDGHIMAVRSVAFAPDSATLFSAGDDGRIFQWDARSGALLKGSLRPVRPAPPTPGIRSDDPSRADWLGMRADAEMLATLITAASTQAPLAVALLGEWGAGKSSLMLQVSDEVDRKAGSGADYVGSVCQVRFNAWHYSDDRVWTGLIGHLFRSLSAAAAAGRPPPGPDTIRAESDRLHGQLADERRRYDRLSRPPPGGPALLAGEAWRRRGSLLLRALLTVAALGVGVLGALAGLTTAFTRAGDWARSIDNVRRQARRSRAERAEEARQRVAALEDQLAQVDAAVRLARLLQRQSDQDPYGAWRGLPGEVYRDLAELSADLDSLRAQRQVDGQPGPGPLERIILYVDDLDRCAPARVVEILAAVHLMLALPLFVVIVAVDPRWLLDALQHHYHELFARSTPVSGGFDPGDRPATPLDYLDKIFQIAFTVRRPSAADAAGFLASLLRQEPAGGGLAGGTPGPVGAAPAAGGDGLVPPDPPPGPARPPSGGPAGDSATDPAERPSPAVPGREAATGPGSLVLHPPETEFLVALGPLMTTPRAAKKLVNLYRLVRIGIPEEDLPAFIGGGGYQAVQVLLAVLTATPDAAPAVFTAIRAAAPGTDICAVIAGTGPAGERIAGTLDGVRLATHGMADDIRAYQHWCPALARYSFYTRALAGP